jgi:hypothetical protein
MLSTVFCLLGDNKLHDISTLQAHTHRQNFGTFLLSVLRSIMVKAAGDGPQYARRHPSSV